MINYYDKLFNIIKSSPIIIRLMGRIRRLVLGNKDEDIEVLKEKYGLPPSKYIPLPNGLTLHVRDEGDSKALPIVLVHGNSEDLHTWNKLAKKLVENFR